MREAIRQAVLGAADSDADEESSSDPLPQPLLSMMEAAEAVSSEATLDDAARRAALDGLSEVTRDEDALATAMPHAEGHTSEFGRV